MRTRSVTRLAVLALTLGGCLGDGSGLDDGGGSEDGGGGDDGGDDGVPSDGDCEQTRNWDPSWAALEQDVLDIVNMHRAQGANCGSQGSFGPAPPLTMQANLRCAARLHSKDMVDRGFFDHDNPDGESPWDRMEEAGYTGWTAVGENIAAGSPDAAGTMAQWMGSDGHCANIMNPQFTEIGVGYYPGGMFGHMWTQTFGRR